MMRAWRDERAFPFEETPVKNVTFVRLLPALLIGFLGFTPLLSAQAPAAAPQALTYDMAVQVIDAAEAEARKNMWNMTIVVTDAAGIPVVLRRMPGATARSYDLATRKAATVVATKLTTAAYGEQLKTKAVAEVPNGITFAGGVPIMRGSEFIGAIGTSGARADQDEVVSKAGASVIK
jgi:glc operon protein GlcG